MKTKKQGLLTIGVLALILGFAFMYQNHWSDTAKSSDESMESYFKTQDDLTVQGLDIVQIALEQYKRDNGKYPESLDELQLDDAEKYHYGRHTLGNEYVVGVELKSKNNPLLNNNDGFIFGVDCDRPIYCRQTPNF